MSRTIPRVGILAVVLLAACHTSKSPSVSSAPGAARLDSVTLERTICFGTCPAYLLSVTREGVVRFRSNNRDDSTVATDRVSPAIVDSIDARAARIRFADYPDDIQRNQRLCRDFATDHPTVIVGLFGQTSKRVTYYTGCYGSGGTHERPPELVRLAELAAAIDSLTRSERWVRPNRLR